MNRRGVTGLLVFLLLGLAIGWFAERVLTTRYDFRYSPLVRLDRRTGEAWLAVGSEWVRIREPESEAMPESKPAPTLRMLLNEDYLPAGRHGNKRAADPGRKR